MTRSITFVVRIFNTYKCVVVDIRLIVSYHLDDPNGSAKCAELNCSYNCKLTPAGPKCYCQQGQEPNGNQCQGA